MAENQLRLNCLGETIDELKEEKTFLIERLTKLKEKRKSLEKTLNQAESRYVNLKDNQEKLLEVLKRAKFQVENKQSQVDIFKDDNDVLKKEINELNNCIKEEKEQRHLEQRSFEDKLRALTKRFIDHKTLHEPHNIEKNASAVIKDIENTKEAINKKKNNVINLETQVAKLENGASLISSELMFLYSSVKEANEVAQQQLKSLNGNENTQSCNES